MKRGYLLRYSFQSQVALSAEVSIYYTFLGDRMLDRKILGATCNGLITYPGGITILCLMLHILEISTAQELQDTGI